MRLRVAVIDEELPFPADSGKRLRTMNLLTRLSHRHDITFITYNSTDETVLRKAEEYWRGYGVNVVLLKDIVPVKSGLAFYGRLAANLVSPLPYSVQVHNRQSLRNYIKERTGDGSFDMWHCEWTPFAESCLDVVREPWLVMAHNVESLIWQRMYETESQPLKRWYIKQQWKKYVRFEKRAYSQTPMLVTVSENDAALAKQDFGASSVRVVDNGVDPDYFHPNTGSRHAARVPHRLLFLGSLDWRPNVDAIKLLLDEVFPAIKKQIPLAELQIVGRRPGAELVERVKSAAGVTIHSDVPDVRPFLWECGTMIVPLRIGGGSRLKILEALATSCPVVSTAIGAEGLNLKHGHELMIAYSTNELIAMTVSAIEQPQDIQRLADAGRETVCRNYAWDSLAVKLEKIWSETVSLDKKN
ncbi:MAG: glycosyltransferase family 4 protein [Planctomycetaceae bacterium]|jgi:glycosyltransferase involved in cell wall biosynthesis|nr:glycosyltransferase family 4 protein [Planctomycetaceae bacterium]